ncbi:MAG TPA: HD domain-containing phosphohydrolase [Nocardioides sp.]|uniref:HD domain-containing phosphohydrolase n=1 Tax=Nocardioides sp. TaxID=35761 RepID=UPI002D7EF281|nr:HD domain-containing phosphohydrolase [Nocardioides sp.]HET6652194.1 HD domain-containing phosphohydrolase [Nocardioides sp.]
MFRLLGLLGGLSLATDLGTGAPLEESLKRAVVATRLAEALDSRQVDNGDVIYTALLQHLGCTAYAHETAELWGDDVTFVRLAFLTDATRARDLWGTFVGGLAGSTGWSRPRVAATMLTRGRKAGTEAPAATCEIARDASRLLGLPDSVQAGLFHSLTMWDGKGHPSVAGDAIPLATRVMHVASVGVLFALHAGTAEATAQVRRRAGSYLDPAIADVFVDRADELVGDLDEIDAYTALLDAEPDPVHLVADDQIEPVARTFGNLADLKSTWLQGHSGAVADLAASAVQRVGLADHVAAVRVAGHLHDLGRIGVPSRIWNKPGPLSAAERDQAQLHAYHSERILARVPALADLAVLVGQHHERCDGSGYHRGLTGAQLPMPSRVLAAADRFRSLVEDRPYRPALSPAEAGRRLREDARNGGLDGDAVAAVLAGAGLGAGARRPRPGDLTERQVEVLRLVAHGLSNREIAERLGISARTAEHHVQDVYVKIGASTRAGAALFAMEHGLLDKPG